MNLLIDMDLGVDVNSDEFGIVDGILKINTGNSDILGYKKNKILDIGSVENTIDFSEGGGCRNFNEFTFTMVNDGFQFFCQENEIVLSLNEINVSIVDNGTTNVYCGVLESYSPTDNYIKFEFVDLAEKLDKTTPRIPIVFGSNNDAMRLSRNLEIIDSYNPADTQDSLPYGSFCSLGVMPIYSKDSADEETYFYKYKRIFENTKPFIDFDAPYNPNGEIGKTTVKNIYQSGNYDFPYQQLYTNFMIPTRVYIEAEIATGLRTKLMPYDKFIELGFTEIQYQGLLNNVKSIGIIDNDGSIKNYYRVRGEIELSVLPAGVYVIIPLYEEIDDINAIQKFVFIIGDIIHNINSENLVGSLSFKGSNGFGLGVFNTTTPTSNPNRINNLVFDTHNSRNNIIDNTTTTCIPILRDGISTADIESLGMATDEGWNALVSGSFTSLTTPDWIPSQTFKNYLNVSYNEPDHRNLSILEYSNYTRSGYFCESLKITQRLESLFADSEIKSLQDKSFFENLKVSMRLLTNNTTNRYKYSLCRYGAGSIENNEELQNPSFTLYAILKNSDRIPIAKIEWKPCDYNPSDDDLSLISSYNATTEQSILTNDDTFFSSFGGYTDASTIAVLGQDEDIEFQRAKSAIGFGGAKTTTYDVSNIEMFEVARFEADIIVNIATRGYADDTQPKSYLTIDFVAIGATSTANDLIGVCTSGSDIYGNDSNVQSNFNQVLSCLSKYYCGFENNNNYADETNLLDTYDGLDVDNNFNTFYDGFLTDGLTEFKAKSGTEIINEFCSNSWSLLTGRSDGKRVNINLNSLFTLNDTNNTENYKSIEDIDIKSLSIDEISNKVSEFTFNAKGLISSSIVNNDYIHTVSDNLRYAYDLENNETINALTSSKNYFTNLLDFKSKYTDVIETEDVDLNYFSYKKGEDVLNKVYSVLNFLLKFGYAKFKRVSFNISIESWLSDKIYIGDNIKLNDGVFFSDNSTNVGKVSHVGLDYLSNKFNIQYNYIPGNFVDDINYIITQDDEILTTSNDIRLIWR